MASKLQQVKEEIWAKPAGGAYNDRGDILMGNDCCLPVGVAALACAIAREIPNDDDLALLAAAVVQLGDTLATLAAQRAACPPPKREPAADG